VPSAPAPLRLRLDRDALVANWRWLARQGGSAACGAAIKADGYGLGAREVVERLAEAGCRDFFVSSWWEAEALGAWPEGLSLSVLHGVGEGEVAFALAHPARPVLNSPGQVARWRAAGGGVADVMVDTGMNRLGLRPEALGEVLDGIEVDTLMSHLACAEEDETGMSARQLTLFERSARAVPARRRSLANSAGVCLGPRYAFDLTRPGLALFGGVPRAEAAGMIRPVVRPEAVVVQRRRVPAGESIGYGATHVAAEDEEVAILNLGYADGYLRAFSSRGHALAGGVRCPVLGRVSMDLVAVGLPGGSGVQEGDWLAIGYNLAEEAAVSGLSQYELLTGLGARYQRHWQ
jgi:alanine racemase